MGRESKTIPPGILPIRGPGNALAHALTFDDLSVDSQLFGLVQSRRFQGRGASAVLALLASTTKAAQQLLEVD